MFTNIHHIKRNKNIYFEVDLRNNTLYYSIKEDQKYKHQDYVFVP